MKSNPEKSEISSLIVKLCNNLSRDLQKHPHLLVNEHDLKAYFYSKLVKEDVSKFVIDKDKDENYLIHCEYPRGYYRNGEFNYVGWWDMAILNEFQDNKYWWTEKPVHIGIELKLHIDEKKNYVIKCINYDQPAVESIDGFNVSADWAVLFHLNIGKKEHDNTYNEVKNYFEEKLKNLNPKTFYVYIETYKDGSKPKVVLP